MSRRTSFRDQFRLRRIPVVALLFGGTLVLLSGYQLSPYKHRCLKYCRTPLGFLMEYHEPGIRGAAETSFRFSVFRVGCCWASFAVMVVVGVAAGVGEGTLILIAVL